MPQMFYKCGAEVQVPENKAMQPRYTMKRMITNGTKNDNSKVLLARKGGVECVLLSESLYIGFLFCRK